MRADEIAFIEGEMDEARRLQQLPKEGQIAALCDKAGCNESMTKAHAKAYLKRQWNPHPPERFKRWWQNAGYQETERATDRGWSVTGEDGKPYPINHVTAYNCEAVREIWREHLREQREELRVLKGGTNEIPF